MDSSLETIAHVADAWADLLSAPLNSRLRELACDARLQKGLTAAILLRSERLLAEATAALAAQDDEDENALMAPLTPVKGVTREDIAWQQKYRNHQQHRRVAMSRA
ncbi:hypothetical protein [Candidatus Contendibacter odensensis]|uniref:Uncharacterized protein n=1 Tax=Candidatus Contendobacter odensis Run_B_J11 TaxID=1400861 RepID=A0A7U7GEV9_9GAMM|nr:hypothetical protein [Candidatus Contendobacter odensis]CDH46984.1 hypothetical protein BN874_690034 [Candidatus Contendobacter odensis Run_B_J11]